MRRLTFSLLLAYVKVVAGFLVWGALQGGYSSRIAATGRMFVTMFGYPSNCENMGGSHPCTLSFACWLVGGSSQPGCGANSWIVSCCVLSKTKALTEFQDIEDDDEELALTYRSREGIMPMLQKRADDYEDRNNEECGITADRIFSKRIIGGKKALFGQYPWQAYIKIATYQCGGVLVSRKFVATAAHCIINARLKDILVYLGELDTQDTGDVEELAPAELHRVKKRIIHPKFRYRVTQPDLYDLSLLELLTEAGRAFHIIPICLPDASIDLTGRSGVVAGWGKVQPSNELLGTNVLRSASVPLLDIQECMKWHTLKKISVDLREDMLCAGHPDGKYDACLGDSGGPLVVQEEGRWTLVGITSAGFGCGEPHQPGIYHRVPATTDWIRAVINRRQFGVIVI
ncbi:unnamed protein product [Callosobruchus maculatus]|uniref:Peptidase S1 domain-containing protein n=1 Tax=Callosobruchus maculatus TaxID=64391 RepID=A0A653BHT3_CALMS|nr:unnamed protein product [Callosobruchus maculatus]